MKIRLTPLSILGALFLSACLWYLFPEKSKSSSKLLTATGALAGIAIFCDLVFRVSIPNNLKKLWLTELVFIIFATIIILLIRTM